VSKTKTKAIKPRQKTIGGNWKTQLGYYTMLLPPALIIFLFSYVPMIGVYIGFVDYKPAKGIFGSKFVGLKYFQEFLSSYDIGRVFRNTMLYNIGKILLVSLLGGMIFALLLYEIRSKVANKVYQTCMLLPAFLSWTVVSAALMILLQPDRGVVNSLLTSIGLEPINWYAEDSYWPTIIMAMMIYKDVGMASIYFYSALLSIDPELFDSASLDGAGRLRQIWYISVPAMSKVFCITLIAALGGVLSGSLSPYFELTLNDGRLYDTTLVLGTYLYNGLQSGRYSFMTAVGLVQSLIGLILVVSSNTIIKKVDPDSSLF